MKRILCGGFLLGVYLGITLLASAEEPILVINPHGHSADIHDLMFTPDGEKLISVSKDKTIRLWDVASGDLLRTLRAQIGESHQGIFHAGALSPDGRLLAVGGWPYGDGEFGIPVYLFDLERGVIVALLTGHENLISDLNFSPDGHWLVSAADIKVRLWDLRHVSLAADEPVTLSPTLALENEAELTRVLFLPDGRHLLSGDYAGSIKLWELSDDLHTQMNVTRLDRHIEVVGALACAPNGEYIVSAGDSDNDYSIFLWDGDGKFLKKIADRYISTLAISADSSKLLAVGTEDEPAILYALPSGKKLAEFHEHDSAVTASTFYGNNLVATAGGNAQDMYIWNADTQEVLTHIVGKGRTVRSLAFGSGLKMAFGNTYTGLGHLNPGSPKFSQLAEYPDYTPLERSFNFADMTLTLRQPEEKAFRRTIVKQGKHKLERVALDELEITGTGTIKNEGYGSNWIHSYTFTPNGDVITGSAPRIKRFGPDGTLLSEFFGHTERILALSISEDGRLLASTGNDQLIKIWNLDTTECLATLFVASDNEWICWTPQGYYAASAGGEQYIGWQLNQGMERAAKYYPVSVFRKQFFHPELVKRTIALGNFDLALASVNAESVQKIETQSIMQVLPPQIDWIAPQDAAMVVSQPTLRIQADIQSESDLQTVKILVNGRSQATSRGLSLGDEQAEPLAPQNQLDREITLVPGQNLISVFAANTNAGVTSESRLVVYEAEELKPNLYMLAVGVSQYQRSELQLDYADDDARAISQIFHTQQGQLYDQVVIRELYDQDATQQNILDAVAWLQSQAKPGDVAVLFVAAHGQNERGTYYLLPADGEPTDLERTGISWNDLSSVLGHLPSRVLLFLDTCHSGQFGQDAQTQPQQLDNTEALRLLASDEYGVVILAASTGREFSLEHPDWGHGAFTAALIEALEQGKADYSQDGVIHLRELDLYLAERVEELTNGEQHPTTQKPSTISRFAITSMP